jgi:hypothetical protein
LLDVSVLASVPVSWFVMAELLAANPVAIERRRDTSRKVMPFFKLTSAPYGTRGCSGNKSLFVKKP